MLKEKILESVEAKNSLLFIEKDINIAINKIVVITHDEHRASIA